MTWRDLLPASSPACTHQWQQDPVRCVYLCSKCGYELTALEILSAHEGDIDQRAAEGRTD